MYMAEQTPTFPSGTVLAIYLRRKKPEKFQVGMLLQQNEDGVFLQRIDTSGAFDGYLFYRAEQIYRFEWDNGYLRSLPYAQADSSAIPFNHWTDCWSAFAQRIWKVFGEDMRTLANGYICSHQAETLTVLPVNRNGDEEKRRTIPYSKITGLCCACKDTVRLEKLHKEKHYEA